MKLISSLVFIVCLSGITGCHPPHDPQNALWFYTFSEGPVNGRDDKLTPASFLELRPDGSYTLDFGRFEYGRWTKDGRAISLTNQKHTSHTYTLVSLSGKEMRLVSDGNTAANFESQPLPAPDLREDPFALGNNRWRLPATHAESEGEIRSRLFNHCQFWEIYFSWALKNGVETIDVRSTPSPIKIYGNGFTLKPFNELPAAWRADFYSDADCRRASEIILDIFKNRTIAWGHTDNKYKMFIGAFQQMENFLR